MNYIKRIGFYCAVFTAVLCMLVLSSLIMGRVTGRTSGIPSEDAAPDAEMKAKPEEEKFPGVTLKLYEPPPDPALSNEMKDEPAIQDNPNDPLELERPEKHLENKVFTGESDLNIDEMEKRRLRLRLRWFNDPPPGRYGYRKDEQFWLKTSNGPSPYTPSRRSLWVLLGSVNPRLVKTMKLPAGAERIYILEPEHSRMLSEEIIRRRGAQTATAATVLYDQGVYKIEKMEFQNEVTDG